MRKCGEAIFFHLFFKFKYYKNLPNICIVFRKGIIAKKTCRKRTEIALTPNND